MSLDLARSTSWHTDVKSPHGLELPGEGTLRVWGFDWQGTLGETSIEVESGVGIGGLVAELALYGGRRDTRGVVQSCIKRFAFSPDGR